MTTNFFSPLSFVAVFRSGIRDPRSGIRDPRSGIRDPGWVKIRIRDKHPGSATLVEIPTVVVVVFVSRVGAGLLRPRPSLKQIEQSSSGGKFRERHSN